LPSWTYGALRLVNLTEAQLAATLSLTTHQARRLAAAFEMYRRLARAVIPKQPSALTPELIVDMLHPWILADQEHFWCLALDARKNLLGDPIEISRGDVNGTDAGPRPFYRAALRSGASSVVAVHHHPTGAVEPSLSDLAITHNLTVAGHIVQVPLRDHLILAPGRWISLRRDFPAAFPGANNRSVPPWMMPLPS
jgi:DNA repair protein RadC